jgi:hypothetical protein
MSIKPDYLDTLPGYVHDMDMGGNVGIHGFIIGGKVCEKKINNDTCPDAI